MNFNKILTVFLILFLTACQQIDDDKKVINYSNYLKYSNTGFTLVYDEQLRKDNKIDAMTSANGDAFGKPKFQIITAINHTT